MKSPSPSSLACCTIIFAGVALGLPAATALPVAGGLPVAVSAGSATIDTSPRIAVESMEPDLDARPDIPQLQDYETRVIGGFTVLLHRSLADRASTDGARVVAALTWDLDLLIERIPEHALDLLRRTTPIWITPSLPASGGWAARGLCHHPSPEWLDANGYGRDRAGAIEICNTADYLLWRAEQPLCVLHEMAHAYQFQLHDPPRIREAYERAKASGGYDAVAFVMLDRSETRRAYAMNNHMEYFAELSEAYYGRNDFFPFTRVDLLEHDPLGHAMIEAIWQTQALVPDEPRLKPSLPLTHSGTRAPTSP